MVDILIDTDSNFCISFVLLCRRRCDTNSVMEEPMKNPLALAAAVALNALSSTAALAEYPERPIEMIVAYSAGGGTDVAARTLAPFIEKYLNGATITVVNKPGAGG